jgi:hypothetical protein
MELFKTSKKPPIKFRGFEFIGFHDDYSRCCYYFKSLGFNNYELMECILEGTAKKPEVGAGTKVSVLDPFMTFNLLDKKHNFGVDGQIDFVHRAIEDAFPDADITTKNTLKDLYTSTIPKEIKHNELLKKYIKQDYNVLYCKNDEKEDRKMAIVNIVLVKEEHVCSNKKDKELIDIDRHYTIYQPLRFLVRPDYIKGTSDWKYYSEELPAIIVNHDLIK